ncbi:MAG: type II secretion system F family protein [Propioniciclava sp.]
MIDLLIAVLPGLVSGLAVWLLARGILQLRTDPLADVPAEVLLEGQALSDTIKEPTGTLPQQLGRRFVPTLRSLAPEGALHRLQRLIDLAGRPQNVTVDSVLATYGGLLVVAIPLSVLLLLQGQLLAPLLIVLLVAIYPVMRLTTTARHRRERIDRDLPDFLDVLAVTVSAGIAFRRALTVVAERFGGPLAEELATTLYQIANGASVRAAFQSLRRRTNSEPLNQFVTAYLQAEELGAPLVDTLNQIAADMRKEAAQRSLQAAHRVEPRITLVTILVLVPGVMVLVLASMILGSGVDFGALLGG